MTKVFFNRQGFIIYLICVLALCMLIMAFALSRHKSGAVLLLAKTIDQEKMIVLAQAGVYEILAEAKIGVNDLTTEIGKSIHKFWKSSSNATLPHVVWKRGYSSDQLLISNAMADEILGGTGKITGEATIVVEKAVDSGSSSFLGSLQISVSVSAFGMHDEVIATEHRDVKIVDLSDPFIDKYALFVKSFCSGLNSPGKNLVIQGITDEKLYSFVYLGNRSYPLCAEFPAGSRGSETPPVLLDLDFRRDKNLLGGFYAPAGFKIKNAQDARASQNQLFWVKNEGIPFSNFADKFQVTSDYHRVDELRTVYENLIKACSPAADEKSSVAYPIMKEHRRAGGKPENSKIFHSLLKDCFAVWRYYYGYSDYSSIVPRDKSVFTQRHPFSGILSYFEYIKNINPQRIVGGKMPRLFGENCDTCVYVEGPAYLRFFKLALIDECDVKFSFFAGIEKAMEYPAVPMRYDPKAQTFAGKSVGAIDKMTDKLMSHPVEHLSINNFFFGTGENQQNLPTTVGGINIQGYNVFPYFNPQLETVSHFYQTAKDFIADRVKEIDGRKVLDLDGISLIVGVDGFPLKLHEIGEYRGKGMIAMFRGNCTISDLQPMSDSSLRIYLMNGRLLVTSPNSDVTIRASLIATTYFPDNSLPNPDLEGSILGEGKNIHIIGNLLIDNLFDLSGIKKLMITHDYGLYFSAYPVRVSIGPTKTYLAFDYRGKNG